MIMIIIIEITCTIKVIKAHQALAHTVTAGVEDELEMLTCCRRKGSVQQVLPEDAACPAWPSGVGRAPRGLRPLPNPGEPPLLAGVPQAGRAAWDASCKCCAPDGAGELPDTGLLPFREETVLQKPHPVPVRDQRDVRRQECKGGRRCRKAPRGRDRQGTRAGLRRGGATASLRAEGG